MNLVQQESAANGLHIVTLNRPEKLNALSHALVSELLTVVSNLERRALSHEIRSIAFRSSSEKAFCVGADLAERINMDTRQVSSTLTRQRELMDAIAALPVPTFAVIEGAAFGGGLELALTCDFRFCSPKATVGLTETRLAIIPGSGGTQRLTRLVGECKAKELIFTARRLSGAEAESAGVVNRCVENPMDLVKAWAADIELAGPVAIGAAKKAIEGGLHMVLEDALDHERECYELVLQTEDRIEGLKAFSEKRPPSYKGK